MKRHALLKYALAAAIDREPFTGYTPHWPARAFLQNYRAEESPHDQLVRSLTALRRNHSWFIARSRDTSHRPPGTAESWQAADLSCARYAAAHWRALARGLTALRNIDTDLLAS